VITRCLDGVPHGSFSVVLSAVCPTHVGHTTTSEYGPSSFSCAPALLPEIVFPKSSTPVPPASFFSMRTSVPVSEREGPCPVVGL
jgi:hypothetical protein